MRPLGQTDMSITPVGFGTWAVGGGGWAFGWGPQDDHESIAALRLAVQSGVNWVDTAATYGLGHSEEIVRQALSDFPEADRPYVFTKCGLIWDDGDPMKPAEHIARPDTIRREVDASLRRLGVERIDLYQVHFPSEDGTPFEDTWSAMLDLKAQGKIRAAGVSNYDVVQLNASASVGRVDTLQPPFSAISRTAAADVIPWAESREVGVIVYSPMHSGLLTGRWSAQRTASLPDGDDWRKHDPEFNGERLLHNLEVANAMGEVGARHGVSAAAAAVAWTLSWPGVTGAIVGGRRPGQIDGWLPGGEITLTNRDLDEIEAVIERTGAGHGPKRPRAEPTDVPAGNRPR